MKLDRIKELRRSAANLEWPLVDELFECLDEIESLKIKLAQRSNEFLQACRVLEKHDIDWDLE